MKMKIKGISGKTFTKNQRLFQRLCVVRPEGFLYRLMEIREILGLPKIEVVHSALEIIGDNPSTIEWKKLSDLISICTQNRKHFFDNLNKEALADFYELIEHILIENKLGKEWTIPLMDVVLSGFFIPPVYNLGIEADRTDKSLKVRLNPGTTLDDIKAAWHMVEKEKSRVFTKRANQNITKKSVEHLIAYAKVKNIQNKHPKLKGTGLVAKLYPISDSEELPDAATDIKTSNNLRQIKSRFKRSL